MFAGDSGATAGDAESPDEGDVPVDDQTTEPDDGATDAPTEEPTTDPTTEPTDAATPDVPAGDARTQLNEALADAKTALEESQTALTNGDFAAYGEAQDRLQVALEAALAADEALGN